MDSELSMLQFWTVTSSNPPPFTSARSNRGGGREQWTSKFRWVSYRKVCQNKFATRLTSDGKTFPPPPPPPPLDNAANSILRWEPADDPAPSAADGCWQQFHRPSSHNETREMNISPVFCIVGDGKARRGKVTMVGGGGAGKTRQSN